MLFAVCLFMTSYGQEISAPQGCGYDHYVHFLNQAHPGFKKSADHVFSEMAALPREKDLEDLELYTIPVVVHIVYQNEEQNLHDSLIQQVMAVLNEDYQRLNADADNIREEFLDIVGNPQIAFELAGVERVATDTTFALNLLGGSMPDNVKVSASGGSDAWDTEKYLNIWVCNIEGGSLLGYAYPPAGLANWPEGANAPSPELDGVVIHHKVFRRTGEYTASGLLGLGEQTIPVRGRTITHEVGHYLGLRHIWGDGLLSIIGIPDCSEDDGVSDTPNQGASSQFSCDPEQNTCTDEGEDDMPDMFENYMDYSSEDCLNSFTKGQVAIMRSVLENERSGLISRTPTDVYAVEATEDFRVFPNPASDQFVIEANMEQMEAYQVRLYNMQGQLVRSPELMPYADRQTVNVSNLPSGLYSLLITQGSRHYSQKVVIR